MPNKKKSEMFIPLLIYCSVPILIHGASIAVQEDETCPITSRHCICSEGPFHTIHCANISDVNTLQDVVSNFTERTFVFELRSLKWTSFPVRSLESPYLMSMVISNSTFDRLFDNVEATASNPNVLHHLSLENVTIIEEWSWSQLNFLNRLDIFFAYNTSIGGAIPSDFSQHVSKTLKFLSISQSNITEVEPESLGDLRNLTYLRISHSKLRTLTRDILPSPSRLGQLRLDHNLIAALPDDMFDNMPNLTVISLSNNRLSVLSEELFRPLWKPNVYLELRNNPIKCDCRIRWVVTSISKPNIIGKCAYPKRLFGRDIINLTEADLAC